MLRFETDSPKALLAKIKEAIAAGHITTWSCDQDGDFTHTPTQWRNCSWLRPHVVPGTALELYIIYAKGAPNTRELYAVYHGRFLEMMLAHFDRAFTSASASALPTPEDATAQA